MWSSLSITVIIIVSQIVSLLCELHTRNIKTSVRNTNVKDGIKVNDASRSDASDLSEIPPESYFAREFVVQEEKKDTEGKAKKIKGAKGNRNRQQRRNEHSQPDGALNYHNERWRMDQDIQGHHNGIAYANQNHAIDVHGDDHQHGNDYYNAHNRDKFRSDDEPHDYDRYSDGADFHNVRNRGSNQDIYKYESRRGSMRQRRGRKGGSYGSKERIRQRSSGINSRPIGHRNVLRDEHGSNARSARSDVYGYGREDNHVSDYDYSRSKSDGGIHEGVHEDFDHNYNGHDSL